MNYIEFSSQRPVLAGSITVNGRNKGGIFKAEYNRWSNSIDYAYYTEKGNKGKGGFTLKRAFALMNAGILKLTK